MKNGSYEVNSKSNFGYVDNEGINSPGVFAINNGNENGVESEPNTGTREPEQGKGNSTYMVKKEELSQTTHGLFKYTPVGCRKIFLSAAGLLFFLCVASTIQGMLVNGFVNVVITTLERRFDLRSAESGFIASSYDVGSLLAVIPISYFGGLVGASKPRYIAFGLLCMGSGSLLFSLPHFITDQYLSLEELVKLAGNHTRDENLCQEDSKTAEAVVTTLSKFKWFFYFGQFLNGVGAAPVITLGTTLLDDSVPRLSAPLYIGIFQTFFVVGPAIGYMLGGSLLELYVDFGTLVTELPFTASDQIWVGAWWVGFVIAWVMSWACAFFIFCYPALLPTNPITSNKLVSVDHANGESYGSVGQQSANNIEESSPKDFKQSESAFVQIPLCILALLKNPTYMLISFGGAFDGIALSGLSTFLPKFIQVQYGYTAGFSAILFGMLVTPSGGFGTFSGGYVSKRFKLNRNQVLKMYIVCQIITIPSALAILMYCENSQSPGVNTAYNAATLKSTTLLPSSVLPTFEAQDSNHEKGLSLKATCNANCGSCGNLAEFIPVCGSDNRLYFNACYAGCKDSKDTNGTKEYFNCACVEEDSKSAIVDSCNVGCNNFVYFAIMAFIIIWMTFMAAMPSVVATLRFVRPEERSLGLGIQTIVLRLLGTIPGPALYGRLIDEACILSSGKCLMYNNYSMSVYLTIITCAAKCAAVLCFVLALYTSRWCKIPEDPDVDVEIPSRKPTAQEFVSTRKLTR